MIQTDLEWFSLGKEKGWISTPELEMIRFMEQEFGEVTPVEKLCTVFLNLFLSAGHVCLPLTKSPAEWGQILELDADSISTLEDIPTNPSEFEASRIIGEPETDTPIVIDSENLSFRRYWEYENSLIRWVEEWTEREDSDYNFENVKSQLDLLFIEAPGDMDWQKAAVALSVIKPFLIISGGPGTGKTTTVAKILALHQRLAGGVLRIALAAPTGKAAGRMGEALNSELTRMNLPDDELKIIPKEAKTIHRLLYKTRERGLLPEAEKEYLNYDLVVIDEASMIDLTLMIQLIDHVKEHTRVILLGDKDQLASVEAGSVFADLCQKRENKFSPGIITYLENLGFDPGNSMPGRTGNIDSIVYLTKSYRFGADSGIGRLAEAVKSQNSSQDEIIQVIEESKELGYSDFKYSQDDIRAVGRDLADRVAQLDSIHDPKEMLRFWKSEMWLTVLRRGLDGSDYLNRLSEQFIMSSKSVGYSDGWYHGRLIMITRNDYSLGVFNGDLGVCVKGENGELRVCVETGSDLKYIHPKQLLHFTPAYFLTVHKSQGSEFEHVKLLLPSKNTPVLSKELLYTAITRAKNKFTLYGDMDLFIGGINRPLERYSGLRERFDLL